VIAQLRQKTVERLADVPAFRHVSDSRQPQLRREMLPALRVYTSTTAQGRSINIPDFLATGHLVIQAVAEDVTDARSAAAVDALCTAVKEWLLCDPTWLALGERNVEGEQRPTVATMTFAFQYSEWYEPVIPDRLEQIHIDVDVISPAADPNRRYPGPDGRIEVVADFVSDKKD